MPEITLVIRTVGADGQMAQHTERRRIANGGAPLTIGRNPSSDIAVADKRVSWSHARIWIDDGTLFVRDNGSRNGTGVDGHRIDGTRELAVGSTVNVAGALQIDIENPTGTVVEDEGQWFLDDLVSGRRHPVTEGVFALVPEDKSQPTLKLTQKGQAWWLLGGGVAVPVEPGVPFRALGHDLVLNHTSTTDMGTVGSDTTL